MQRLLPLRARHDVFHPSTLDYGKWLAAVRHVGQQVNLALLSGIIGIVALLLINGPLVAIALLSVGIALAVYLHQIDRLYIRWLPWRRWWRPANRPLTLALLSLGGSFLAGVGLLQLWQRSPWPGLVTLVLAQTIVMAIALLRRFATHSVVLPDTVPPRTVSQATMPPTTMPQTTKPQTTKPPPNTAKTSTLECDAILEALAAEHPVHQLIAIRRALRWASTTPDSAAVDDIADCFAMLLRRQPDPCVQRSLQRGLAQIRPLAFAPNQRSAAVGLSNEPIAKTGSEAATEPATVAHPIPVSAD
ncbi:MAG: hypothetical protein WBA10_05370 [Elainellaceae cyanobacterium]